MTLLSFSVVPNLPIRGKGKKRKKKRWGKEIYGLQFCGNPIFHSDHKGG